MCPLAGGSYQNEFFKDFQILINFEPGSVIDMKFTNH